MANAITYCTEEKRKDCPHWDADKKCPYMRPCEKGETPTCFIAGIEKNYEKEAEASCGE